MIDCVVRRVVCEIFFFENMFENLENKIRCGDVIM